MMVISAQQHDGHIQQICFYYKRIQSQWYSTSSSWNRWLMMDVIFLFFYFAFLSCRSKLHKHRHTNNFEFMFFEGVSNASLVDCQLLYMLTAFFSVGEWAVVIWIEVTQTGCYYIDFDRILHLNIFFGLLWQLCYAKLPNPQVESNKNVMLMDLLLFFVSFIFLLLLYFHFTKTFSSFSQNIICFYLVFFWNSFSFNK